MVLRGVEVPPLTPAGGAERRRHGGGVLRRPHRRHAVLLGERLRHIRHARVRAAGPGSAGGLDHVVHRPGRPQHHLDVQDRPRLLQSPDGERRAEGQGRCGREAREQPHGLTLGQRTLDRMMDAGSGGVPNPPAPRSRSPQVSDEESTL